MVIDCNNAMGALIYLWLIWYLAINGPKVNMGLIIVKQPVLLVTSIVESFILAGSSSPKMLFILIIHEIHEPKLNVVSAIWEATPTKSKV